MQVQTAKKHMRLQRWANQINTCRQSGKSVKNWCAANEVNEKTYYYRLKRVQEEMFEMIAPLTPVSQYKSTDMPDPSAATLCGLPSFAALGSPASMPQPQKDTTSLALMQKHDQEAPCISVLIGSHRVEIANNADGKVIEQVLKAVSRI